VAFADLAAEVSGNLPGASPILVETWVKRAWRAIRDKRLWSFLVVDDSIVCPALITAGTLNITQYSNVVTADATASAALIAVGTLIETPFQALSIRVGGPGTTSEIYNIVSVDTTTNPAAIVITLDRAIVEATAAASQYQCYRPYIQAPIPDFLRWISIVDMVNGWKMNQDYTSVDFDKVDPQRQSLGQAYNWGFYKGSLDSPPIPIYEAWPGPTDGQSFYVRYRRQGLDFSAPTDTQPLLIPDQLIVQWTLAYYAYPWARINVGHFPALAKVNWSSAINQAMEQIHGVRGRYVGLLQDAIRQDDNQATQSVWNRGHGLRQPPTFPYPVDANFIQSHLVNL
jgi:hypothetical protein